MVRRHRRDQRAGTAAVLGQSFSNATGVYGWDGGVGTGSGVAAVLSNNSNASPALTASTAGTGSAVLAKISNTSSSAPAVSASTKGSGPAVLASHPTGVALAVTGKVSFSRSGVVSIPSGQTKATVTLTLVTASSLVLATMQQNVSGVSVQSAVPASGSFTINLTKAPTAAVKVAWFVIN